MVVKLFRAEKPKKPRPKRIRASRERASGSGISRVCGGIGDEACKRGSAAAWEVLACLQRKPLGSGVLGLGT